MPQFIDHHKGPPPPPEMVKAIQAAVKAGKTDPKTGLKAIMGMSGKDDQYCVMEGPNAQAIHKYHESMGIHLGPGDVVELVRIVA